MIFRILITFLICLLLGGGFGYQTRQLFLGLGLGGAVGLVASILYAVRAARSGEASGGLFGRSRDDDDYDDYDDEPEEEEEEEDEEDEKSRRGRRVLGAVAGKTSFLHGARKKRGGEDDDEEEEDYDEEEDGNGFENGKRRTGGVFARNRTNGAGPAPVDQGAVQTDPYGIRAELNGPMLRIMSKPIEDMRGYFITVTHENAPVISDMPLFRDQRGHFAINRAFNPAEHKILAQDLPLNALRVPRNRPIQIEVYVTIYMASGARESRRVSSRVFISGESATLSEWIRPMIDIMCFSALARTGQYSNTAIGDIKHFFQGFGGFDQKDAIFLDNRLKLNSARFYELSQDTMCEEYLMRGFAYNVSLSFAARVMNAMEIPERPEPAILSRLQYFVDHLHLNRDDLVNAIQEDAKIYVRQDYRTRQEAKKKAETGADGGAGRTTGGASGEDGGFQIEIDDSYDKEWALDLLDLQPEATLNEMKRAYRRKIIMCHPDRHAGQSVQIQEKYKKMAQELNIAKKILEF